MAIKHIYLHNIQQNRNKKRKLRSNKNTIHRKCTNCGKSRRKNKTIADIIEETTKSIVGISKLKNAGKSILSTSNEAELGLGTGIIISENGYILSNAHVTGEKYSKSYITLENGQTYEGKVMWSDESLDLSITKIEAKNLSYAKLGDSSKIRVGETVYAIGNQ